MITTRLLALLLLLHLTILGFLHTKIKKAPDLEQLQTYSRLIQGAGQWQGKVAPDVTATLLTGETFRLSEHIGKDLIVLNFFATWCGPCRDEMPELNRFYEAHRQEHVVLVGIDSDEPVETVQAFVKELAVQFPVALDPDARVLKAYGVGSFPTTVVINATGRIQLYDSGQIDNADAVLGPLLKSHAALLEAGGGISADAYQQLLASQPTSRRLEARASPALLQGRAKHIAEQMDCPCGCTKKVLPCGCQTAKRIKAKLQTMSLEGKTDQEVILALNQEFCVPPWRGDD